MGNVGETLDRHSKTASAGPGKGPVSDCVVSHSDNMRCTAQQPQGPASLKRLDVDHLLSHKRLGGAQPGPALLVSEFPCGSGQPYNTRSASVVR